MCRLLYTLPINRADVVQSTTSDVGARGGVGAGHHPGRAQRDRVHLVGRVAVPHDQLTILTGRHQVPDEKYDSNITHWAQINIPHTDMI